MCVCVRLPKLRLLVEGEDYGIQRADGEFQVIDVIDDDSLVVGELPSLPEHQLRWEPRNHYRRCVLGDISFFPNYSYSPTTFICDQYAHPVVMDAKCE